MSKLLVALKIIIIIYAIWRFSLSLYHILSNNLEFSSVTCLSFAILTSHSLLLCAVIFESRVLIEIWMICFILKFGSIIFGVFNFDVEKNSFFPNNVILNTILIVIIQLIILVLVMILYKNINDYDDKVFGDSVSEVNSSPNNKQTVEYRHRDRDQSQYNMTRVDGACVFEPILIIDLLT